VRHEAISFRLGENSLTSSLVTGEYAWLWWAALALGAIVLLLLLIVWRKGRPFAPGDVFRASRLSRGNRVFPHQVLITPTSVVHYTARWFGREEKSIHMAHVASVNIQTGVLFSDVLIETSGGEHPIVCHGHRKGDATRMKELIEQYQTAYYRHGAGSTAPAPGVGPTPPDRSPAPRSGPSGL
jgi:predicted small integral membrane protein